MADAVASSVRLDLLGPVDLVLRDGSRPRLGTRPLGLLAVLALRLPHVVSVAQLLSDVWGEEDPSPVARNRVQAAVSVLRPLVGSAALLTQAPGYRMDGGVVSTDVGEFTRLTGQARATRDPVRARELFESALSLTRGQPLSDLVELPFTAAAARSLSELIVTARSDRNAAAMDVGDHESAIPDLLALVTEHPLREPFWSQYVLALYRSGRQADALLALRTVRTLLDDELGVQPGEQLRRLETAVLRHDPALAPPIPPTPPEPSVAPVGRRPRPESPPAGAGARGRPRAVVSLATASPDVVGAGGDPRVAPADADARFRTIVDATIAAQGGWRIAGGAGRGGTRAAFDSVEAAVTMVLDLRRNLSAQRHPGSTGLRGAVHAGERGAGDRDRIGPVFAGSVLDTCNQLGELAAPGQVLLSAAAFDSVRGHLPEGAMATDLGEHLRRELARPEHIYQLDASGRVRTFPRLPTVDRASHNLPVQTSSLLGRTDEIRELVALIGRERLVTLVGFGGVGKTRLALRVAAELAVGDGDGVWFVDLSGIVDAARIPELLAATLSVGEGTDGRHGSTRNGPGGPAAAARAGQPRTTPAGRRGGRGAAPDCRSRRSRARHEPGAAAAPRGTRVHGVAPRRSAGRPRCRYPRDVRPRFPPGLPRGGPLRFARRRGQI